MTGLIKTIERISWLGGVLAMLLLASAVVIVCQMIVLRYFLKESTVWQTEYVIFSLMAATFLGSAHVLKQRGHVAVDLLPRALGPGGRIGMELLAALLSVLFLALLAWSGWMHFHEAWTENWTTATVWKLPLWIPLLPLPLGMAMVILQYLAEILKMLGFAKEPPILDANQERRQ